MTTLELRLLVHLQRGGNLDIVLPVVEALVRATPAPSTVELQQDPCGGFKCALRHAVQGKKSNPD